MPRIGRRNRPKGADRSISAAQGQGEDLSIGSVKRSHEASNISAFLSGMNLLDGPAMLAVFFAVASLVRLRLRLFSFDVEGRLVFLALFAALGALAAS